MKHVTGVMVPLALAGALVISGCGGDAADDASDPETTTVAEAETQSETETATDENAEAADGPAPDSVTVVVDGFAFAPAEVRIAAGGTITWDFVETNHTVVIDGVTLSPGGETSITLDTPGTYPYVCGIHSSMRGTVVVV